VDVAGKTYLVVGMAKSGLACAELLKANGAMVYIADSRKRNDFSQDNQMRFDQVADMQFLGEDPTDQLSDVDALVLSPGVPPKKVSFIQEAVSMNKPLIAEIELGYRACAAPVAAITGTNGKTTCTALTGEIFKNSGRKTFVLGNIGTPFALMAPEIEEEDIVVLEAAALQLETIIDFKPKVSAVLNITEDHIDRFDTMAYYIECKERIFENQNGSDYCVLNLDNEITHDMAAKTKAKVVWFSREQDVPYGAFVRNNMIVFRDGHDDVEICATEDVYIPGGHNLENALACTAIAMVSGVLPEVISHTLKTFKGVEHRIEFVREVKGVRYINDSKGTNPDATINAIKAMNRPTVLILGGYDKKNDFDELFEAFNPYIKTVIALGQTKGNLFKSAENTGFKDIYTADSFEEAVLMASEHAGHGDNVLLSPACASYDMFRNFEIRGETFKAIVSRL